MHGGPRKIILCAAVPQQYNTIQYNTIPYTDAGSVPSLPPRELSGFASLLCSDPVHVHARFLHMSWP